MKWFKKNWFNLIAVFLLLMLGLIYLYSNFGPCSGLNKYFKINISACRIIKKEDTHGGFHGDGNLTAIFDCANHIETINNKKNCFSLPNDDEYIRKILDIHELDEKFKLSDEEFDINKIQNGFYCFYGRDLHDDGSSFKHYLNFDLVIYNSDDNILYYYDYDS